MLREHLPKYVLLRKRFLEALVDRLMLLELLALGIVGLDTGHVLEGTLEQGLLLVLKLRKGQVLVGLAELLQCLLVELLYRRVCQMG